MEIVSSREFRSQMGEFFKKALNSDVVIKSRTHGSFKIVPVTDDDTIMSKEEFFAKIDRAKKQIDAGHYYEMSPGEMIESFMERMENDGNV